MSDMLELTLTYPEQRLDQALTLALPDYSRAQCQKLIRDGHVRLDGQVVSKTSLRLRGGERVSIVLPEVVDVGIVAEDIPLDIRYEDDDLLLVNKPSGMVTHPSLSHETGTLVNAVLGYCPDLAGVGSEKRPGVVHRLDKHTSGLIVVAKNDKALRYMQTQFKKRTVEKMYLALVEGHLQPPQAMIDAPIGRDPRDRKRMSVITDPRYEARSSQTRYRVLTYYDHHTFVACYPQTGRTHQIRVHMAYVNHAIVGDVVYGRRKKSVPWLRRHFLHAAGLTFDRPSDDKRLIFKNELPPELQEIIDFLEKESQDSIVISQLDSQSPGDVSGQELLVDI